MKATKCPAREKKNEARKAKKKGKRESKKQILLSAHARISQATTFLNTVLCIWIRKLRNVRPVNGFVVSFRSL